MAKRRRFTDQFRAEVALGRCGATGRCRRSQVNSNQGSTWKHQAVEGTADVFARGGKAPGPTGAEVKDLHAKIGRLAVETDLS